MTALTTKVDGVDPVVAADINNIITALAFTLGIVDTAQSALGRLVLPNSATAPASPSQGEVYYDTDDDITYIFDGTVWVPQRALRRVQHIELTAGAVAIGTSLTDVLALPAFTTTGGLVLLIATMPWSGTASGSAAGRNVTATFDRDASSIFTGGSGDTRYSAASSNMNGIETLFYLDAPSAASHTYKLRASRSTGYSAVSALHDASGHATQLVAIELGP